MRRFLPGLLAAAVLLPTAAHAGRMVDTADLKIDFGGDVKGLFDLVLPYEHLLMPEDPLGQASVDFRLKLDGSYQRWISWSVHHSATATVRGAGLADFGLTPGTSVVASEAIPLYWEALDKPGFRLGGRLDRASISFHIPHVDVTLGRQPVSFGTGYFFTPMDLLAPYTPQVVDREYKPGVDALRIDAFIGMTGHISAVAAIVDEMSMDGLVLAGHGGATVGVFDIEGLVGLIRRDFVIGASTQGSIGPVGVHADLTVTVPPREVEDDEEVEEPFVRVVAGASVLPHSKLSLSAEVYFQSTGTRDPADYDLVLSRDRFARGELWTMGKLYVGVSANYEIIPIVHASLFATLNVLDPSALIGPGLVWSVGSNTELVIGGFVALGERPAELELSDLITDDLQPVSDDELYELFEPGSEFGLMPHQAYVQLKMYF